MKKIQKLVDVYTCDYCNKEFSVETDCLEHELHAHKCPNCKHHFYLFGSEEMCDSPRGCTYEEKDQS